MKRAVAFAAACAALAALCFYLSPRPACELDQRDREELCSDLGYMVQDYIEREGECYVPPVECND